MVNFLRTYYRSIIWLLLIMYALFTPGDKLPHSRLLNFENSDKLVHLILFMGLGFLLLFDTWFKSNRLIFRQLFLIITGSVLFAIISEIIQHTSISNRSGSIFDFYADLAGIVLGCILFYSMRNTISQFFRQIF